MQMVTKRKCQLSCILPSGLFCSVICKKKQNKKNSFSQISDSDTSNMSLVLLTHLEKQTFFLLLVQFELLVPANVINEEMMIVSNSQETSRKKQHIVIYFDSQ